MDVILKKYVLTKLSNEYIGIQGINDEAIKVGLFFDSRLRKLSLEDFFLRLYCSIEKKEEIVQISFGNDFLYITSYKNDDFFSNKFDIVIEEYKLYSNLKEDKEFITKINELIEKYEAVKEETTTNYSKKLMEISLDKFVKENVISFIEYYFKSSTTSLVDKDLITMVISYIESHREELLKKLNNMNGFNIKLLQLLKGIRDISTILSGLGFLAIVFGGPLSLVLGAIGGLVGITTHYSIKAIKNKSVKKILTGFLQELQKSLNIDESDDQLSQEFVKELEEGKQRVLLEEKVKLQSGENIFDFNKRFKEENIDIPVYESGPKLKFGYKEE